MATYEQAPITDAKKHAAQQAVDMHAGNEQQPVPVEQPTEQIDWEKHRQFMRGLG